MGNKKPGVTRLCFVYGGFGSRAIQRRVDGWQMNVEFLSHIIHNLQNLQ
jgi:hypothetical protein